jgi:putative oxidoreductase
MKPLVQEELRPEATGGIYRIGGPMLTLARMVVGTEASIAALLARLTLAVVMFPHCAQKVFGWFGGGGFSGTMNFFTETMHIPWIFALAAILAESLGAVALVLGVGTRVAAFAIATNMIVAGVTSHLQHGFFMDWFRNQNGEGFEYHLLALGLCAILLILGGGTASLDRRLSHRDGIQVNAGRPLGAAGWPGGDWQTISSASQTYAFE